MSHKHITHPYSRMMVVILVLGIAGVIGALVTLYHAVNPNVRTYFAPEFSFQYPAHASLTLEPQTNTIVVGDFLSIMPNPLADSQTVSAASAEAMSTTDMRYEKRQIGSTVFYFNGPTSSVSALAAYAGDGKTTAAQSDQLTAIEPTTSLAVSYNKAHQKEAERVLSTLILTPQKTTTHDHIGHDL